MSAYNLNSTRTEIKRMIAFLLRNCDENPNGPRDIKHFRLVNREFSIIGAEFLLPVIHLTFQTRSFERLRTISQHPYYGQRVTHLHYEADAFKNPSKREENWVMNIFDSKFKEQFERQTPFTVLPKKQADHAKLVRDIEQEDLRDASQNAGRKFHKANIAFTNDQKMIRYQNDAYNVSLMAQAIARLPNLTEVTVSFADAVVPHTSAFRRAYKASLLPPVGDYGHRYPYGVMQLYSVLCGVASAGTKLKTLKFGKVDWQLLQMDSIDFQTIKCAMKHLENLHIMFDANPRGRPRNEYPYSWATFLASNRMCEFVSAAKNLTTLNFSMANKKSINLEYVVGTTTWACLRALELDMVFFAEEALINLLKRHTDTLRELELNNVVLESGDWTSALPAIRNAIKLKEFRALGIWRAHRPFRCWTINTSSISQGLQTSELGQFRKLGMAVKQYVLEGGENPLLDPRRYPDSHW